MDMVLQEMYDETFLFVFFFLSFFLSSGDSRERARTVGLGCCTRKDF